MTLREELSEHYRITVLYEYCILYRIEQNIYSYKLKLYYEFLLGKL